MEKWVERIIKNLVLNGPYNIIRIHKFFNQTDKLGFFFHFQQIAFWEIVAFQKIDYIFISVDKFSIKALLDSTHFPPTLRFGQIGLKITQHLVPQEQNPESQQIRIAGSFRAKQSQLLLAGHHEPERLGLEADINHFDADAVIEAQFRENQVDLEILDFERGHQLGQGHLEQARIDCEGVSQIPQIRRAAQNVPHSLGVEIAAIGLGFDPNEGFHQVQKRQQRNERFAEESDRQSEVDLRAGLAVFGILSVKIRRQRIFQKKGIFVIGPKI